MFADHAFGTTRSLTRYSSNRASNQSNRERVSEKASAASLEPRPSHSSRPGGASRKETISAAGHTRASAW